MQPIQGTLTGQTLSARFTGVAAEYFSANNRQQWQDVPYIFFVHDRPAEEKNLHDLQQACLNAKPEDRDDLQSDLDAFADNHNIELDERAIEVLDVLRHFPKAVLADTITDLGIIDHVRYIGAQLNPAELHIIMMHPDMRNCGAKPVTSDNISPAVQQRILTPPSSPIIRFAA